MEMESFCKQNGIAGRLCRCRADCPPDAASRGRMETKVYAQYQTVIANCGIEIEQSDAFVF